MKYFPNYPFELIAELRQKRVEEISYYESMTLDQLEELSSQSNQYILPRNQAKSRKHALICYTTDNREGAVKEAKILEESMEVNTVIIVKIALL